MEKTLKQIFEKYPLIKTRVANDNKYSGEWLRAMIAGRVRLTDEKRHSHLVMLQKYLNKLGRELSEIKVIDHIKTKKNETST